MVAITASRTGIEDTADVFCPECLWGADEVPAEEALQVATDHEMAPEHLQAELANELVDMLSEALRAERGY
jgi:hypothetical protein